MREVGLVCIVESEAMFSPSLKFVFRISFTWMKPGWKMKTLFIVVEIGKEKVCL